MIIEGVPVRFYYPINSVNSLFKQLFVVIYYHGGGFCKGLVGESFRIFRYSNDIVNLETHHPITRELAVQTDFIVLSVEYVLIQQISSITREHPFPVGLDDCTKVTKHILDIDNANKINIDPTRIAIAGDSAGGNFVTVIATRFTNENMTKNIPCLQILIYPVVQFFDFMLPSYREANVNIFDSGKSGLMLELYLNRSISDDILANNHTTTEQKKQYRPYVDWPLIPSKYRQTYKESINDNIDGGANLRKNAQQTLEPDLSPLDEGFIYAARVKSNGVHVTHRHFENTFLGSLTFLEGIFKLDVAHEMLTGIVHYLKDYL
ncbi:unnamed protein product [Rotaria socialis]|uniref:Alpha/beta hydrolase fold-3 domain-containing protein n=1 Tax=Rotaria socialis TaxID=392032 RepID=A0A819AXJ1_9BILA|nr:unnamed protein product [Rotaria socialis]